ncbi:MAG: hypothetical protein A2499_16090 [Stygiobacter sp. RIFOXYC12_FULL_38_8]|nr:MAG: hypothetical protein A2X62_08100 [Stygiobacter sp. GWC2_38_9]OGU79783.1 MAG: hypothetical protein A2279_14145 [Stygiobacter sp. RIFOXYA12_FULL_38_9]OGV07066.1 MAG: hypothetical protein A2299_03790 [Stygiobacter sp. RIFOXYB2_FULL_37_11]OGV10425.1 MAG: hypothetical protein A2237_03835 [Stygiobacter sp. RIFOXYA2_FULL_38_8]OGV12417.1 MAG: hypothetical protein A2440_14265 [Stygiobacter sp. RIFOXYC2_FULL_38_25]OGV24047.1 MAG: hypothetical protein A2499_16090 [Stygiobacter sp. RIFOXYC12_FULL_
MNILNVFMVIIPVLLSSAFAYYVSKFQVKSQLSSINKQKWIDEFRENLACFLSSADMAMVMTDIALTGDRMVEPGTARKLFQEHVSKMSLYEERLLLYLDSENNKHHELLKYVTSFAYEVYTRPNNLLEKETVKDHVVNIRKLGREISNLEWKSILNS